MDIGTLITASLIITACSTPFVIMHYKHKNKEKAIRQILFKAASEHSCSITNFDVLNSIAIGLDKKAGQLFYTAKRNESDTVKVISLEGIQKCQLVTSATEANKETSNKNFDKLELVFTYHENRKAKDSFEFYNTEYDSFNLAGEFQLAEKWCKIINEQKRKAA